MKRPTVKDEKALAYIEYLESELESYNVDASVSKFLAAIKRQIDNISDLMNSLKLDIDSITEGRDKSFDRVYKLLEKSPQLITTMIEAQKHLKQNSDKKLGHTTKREAAGLLEKAVNKK